MTFFKKNSSKQIGTHFEKQAQAYLQKQGLVLLAKNYHCQLGEIDLIMMSKETLVFIEVRARENTHFGQAIETVDYRKQQKIILTTKHYLQNQYDLNYEAIRFDVLGIESKNKFIWIQNAFTIDE